MSCLKLDSNSGAPYIKLLKHAKFHQSVTVAQSVKALGVQSRGRGFETWWKHDITQEDHLNEFSSKCKYTEVTIVTEN